GLETLPDQKPLNNCRWLLYRRAHAGWELVHRDESGRTREPSPVALLANGHLLVTANPTLTEPGTYNGPAEPTVYRFDTAYLRGGPSRELPRWEGAPAFTEHSYRTVVADGPSGEVLYMQNVGYDVAHMSLLAGGSTWQAAGQIRWPYGLEYPQPQPLRLCYPNVCMRRRAAHFFGVGDIVEPVAEWKAAKHALTGRDWDYVFRRLFYASTPDVSRQPFGAWLEIANRDATAGATHNCDIYAPPDGAAHLLWTETSGDARLRDRFFPGTPIHHSLEQAVVRGGVVERVTLARLAEDEEGLRPQQARYHLTAGGALVVLAQFARVGSGGPGPVYRAAAVEGAGIGPWTEVAFRRPLAGTFVTGTVRGGSAPGDLIDLVGTVPDRATTLGYARVRLELE
ncbi:MAG: hypothetical protein ABIL09_17615, partial [Gemmatimonadota bacterium]